MSLSRQILRLTVEQQDAALLEMAKKSVAGGYTRNQFIDYCIRPITHALHAAGHSKDECAAFRKRARAAYAIATYDQTGDGQKRDETCDQNSKNF